MKTKLVNILNDLEVGLQTEATTNEANEASANEELADYELNIENENNFLNTEITTLTSELGILKGQKLLSDAEVVDCQEILSGYKNSLENANKDFEDSTNNYNDNDERLQEEVALFQEIYNLYEAEVASASEQLKKEVDNDEAGESLIQIEQKI